METFKPANRSSQSGPPNPSRLQTAAEPESAAPGSPSSPATEPAAHVLAASFGPEPWLEKPADPTEAGGEGEGPAISVAGERLSKDAFFQGFRFLWSAPNFVVAPPLKALDIAADDGEARAASDAFYDTCCDVPWLHFLVSPGSIWAERAMVIGLFAFGRATAIRAELAARPQPDRHGAAVAKSEAAASAPAGPGRKPGDMEILNPTKAQKEQTA